MIGVVAAGIVGVVAGTLAHELSHWAVFRAAGIRAGIGLLPPAVSYPDDAPAHVVAVAAVAPVAPAAVVVAAVLVAVVGVGVWPGGTVVAFTVALALRSARLSQTDREQFRVAWADSDFSVGVP